MSQLALARSPHPPLRGTLSPQGGERDGVRGDVPKLLLVGNPNVGKSLLFTRLTNRYVTVSNYAGTTVEITTAVAEFGGQLREVVDTPGANGLTPQSADERVTRDLLLENRG